MNNITPSVFYNIKTLSKLIEKPEAEKIATAYDLNIEDVKVVLECSHYSDYKREIKRSKKSNKTVSKHLFNVIKYQLNRGVSVNTLSDIFMIDVKQLSKIVTATDYSDYLGFNKQLKKQREEIIRKAEIKATNSYYEEIATKSIEPGETLQSVATQYGITRERVRQIADNILIDRMSVKKNLEAESVLFKCPVCGGEKKSNKKYCSPRCNSIYSSTDWNTKLTCKLCGAGFYPPRNWKNLPNFRGDYCSTDCYLKDPNSRLSKRFVARKLKILDPYTD